MWTFIVTGSNNLLTLAPFSKLTLATVAHCWNLFECRVLPDFSGRLSYVKICSQISKMISLRSYFLYFSMLACTCSIRYRLTCAAVSSLQVSLPSLCVRGSSTPSARCSSRQVGFMVLTLDHLGSSWPGATHICWVLSGNLLLSDKQWSNCWWWWGNMKWVNKVRQWSSFYSSSVENSHPSTDPSLILESTP